jgi:hypothetical protein
MTTNPPAVSRSVYADLRVRAHRSAAGNSYSLYEQRKAKWISQNPEATCAQYDSAMQRIARRCGV